MGINQKFIEPSGTITVGIATFHRDESLLCTLRDVGRLTPAPVEVIVVDQTPDHSAETEQALLELDRSHAIRWIRQPEPSLPRARNRILLEATSPWILFVDDDVRFEPSLLGRYLDGIRAQPASAYLGQVCAAGRFHPSMLQDGALAKMDRSKMPQYRMGDRSEVDFVRGCNFLVDRYRAIKAGGFDEALIGNGMGEEMDFAFRLLDLGDKIRFLADAWIVHLSAPSGGCRHAGRAERPEWHVTFCLWMLFFKHFRRRRSGHAMWGGKPLPFLRAILIDGPLRRENRSDPRRWWRAWSGWALAGWRGLRASRRGVCSPFASEPFK